MKRIALLLLLVVLASGYVWAQNKVLSLDGDWDYVEIPNSEVFDITDEITMEAWVMLNGTGRDVKIISRRPAYEYGVYSNNKAETEVFTDGRYHLTRWEDGSTVLDQGQWYDIAGTFDGSQIATYIICMDQYVSVSEGIWGLIVHLGLFPIGRLF